jgi:hypothetical protein
METDQDPITPIERQEMRLVRAKAGWQQIDWVVGGDDVKVWVAGQNVTLKLYDLFNLGRLIDEIDHCVTMERDIPKKGKKR